MKYATILSAVALILGAFGCPVTAYGHSKAYEATLLSSVKTLTLYNDKQVNHRRVPAIPQLQCIGGTAKGLYEVDVMRCTNSGSGYGAEDIEWTCKANLPEEYKLGSTDVLCEGYDSPDDPYILKGSCGVQYRLMLTPKGEAAHKDRLSSWGSGKKQEQQQAYNGGSGSTETVVTYLFWAAFIGVLGFIIYKTWQDWGTQPNNRPPRWGGGGGWGGGNDDDDPPPPYTPRQPPRKKSSYSPRQARQPNQQEGWRPGFWTGALGGAAASYMAGNLTGNRTNRQQNNAGWTGTQQPPPPQQQTRSNWGGGNSYWDNGEGSSSTNSSSSRYESTGFGSTTRR